jgi:hypothetical protein
MDSPDDSGLVILFFQVVGNHVELSVVTGKLAESFNWTRETFRPGRGLHYFFLKSVITGSMVTTNRGYVKRFKKVRICVLQNFSVA